ncbi:hypothetical protein ACQP1W_28685 [Spirillospora sp. CA-255316]
MTSSTTTLPFVIARSHDEEMAGDGESRYGRYVRKAVIADGGYVRVRDDRTAVRRSGGLSTDRWTAGSADRACRASRPVEEDDRHDELPARSTCR